MAERLNVTLTEKGQADLARVREEHGSSITEAVHRGLRLAAWLDGRSVFVQDKDGRMREVVLL